MGKETSTILWGFDAQWDFPGIHDKCDLNRQTIPWEAKDNSGMGNVPAQHTHSRLPHNRAAQTQSRTGAWRGTWDGGDRGWRVGDTGEGLTLLPVCCHPALDRLEFQGWASWASSCCC